MGQSDLDGWMDGSMDKSRVHPQALHGLVHSANTGNEGVKRKGLD